ncbi:MAG TPA: hydrogenase accessory protein HypB, partial [Vicinamibacteria bacterium]|nr:hydrogenase accessory protein HypB [Vicinamibacteria bacterium]
LKYPTIFNTADLAILTKMDLAAAVEFDSGAAHRSLRSVRPGIPVLEVSAKTGQGMDCWFELLRSRSRRDRVQAKGLAR